MPVLSSGGHIYSEFLAEIAQRREVERYLEIGVMQGTNLAGMKVDTAIGIDPGFQLIVDPTVGKRELQLYRMTSDAFFAKVGASDIDFAFLDGMHQFEFLLRDFYNTEACCTDSGLIAMHDCLPTDGVMVSRIPTPPFWTGDVWKVVPILEKWRPDLRIVLVDAAPTGLVCVTNLDPSSTVLRDNYMAIVEEFMVVPNDMAAIERFYEGRKLVSADAILNDYDHSLYFKV